MTTHGGESMNDTEIISLYWKRDESAISETEAKYGAYCRAIARNILSNAQDEQECVNDTYLAAWNSMPPQKPALLKAYLGKIARRTSLKKWRDAHALKRGGSEVQPVLDELAECIPGNSIESALEAAELTRLINGFLGSLPATERRIFLRRYWYLDSIAEIAGSFGFSQSKVKSMLRRMRLKLMKRLKEEGVPV